MNITRGTVLATRLELAGTGSSRNKGLLGRDCLFPGEGLWIVPCEAVHTFFMRFPIDLVYLDRNKRIKKLRSNVSAWRLSACLTAHSVIELPAGTIRTTRTERGDTVELAFAATEAESGLRSAVWPSSSALMSEDQPGFKMAKARTDGLYLLLLGSVAFLLLGLAFEHTSSVPMIDFKAAYYPARCLMGHGDPYYESEVLRIYRAEAASLPSNADRIRVAATRFLYLPTAFCFMVPFAMLPWGPAHLLWMTLTFGGLLLASFLMWNAGANYAPIVSGLLIGFLLANSEALIVLGNAAGIAVSLCVVAVWSFLHKRFIPAGILFLAFSLAIKPQDAGLVWLYFLLAGGDYRRRALQTLAAAVAMALPAILWVWHVAPHWMQEWRSNILAFSAHGGMNDPGPASSGGHGLGMLVNLQAPISVFRDDPRVYNLAGYLLCAPLLLVWVFVTLRSRSSHGRAWLAIAAIATLSMLPVYHHLYDAKLLLLTVPACAMLWAEGGLIGWLALLVNSAGFVLTGDLPWAILFGLINNLHPPLTPLTGQMLIAVQVFPAPLILLVMGVFYLWVYMRNYSAPASPQPH